MEKIGCSNNISTNECIPIKSCLIRFKFNSVKCQVQLGPIQTDVLPIVVYFDS